MYRPALPSGKIIFFFRGGGSVLGNPTTDLFCLYVLFSQYRSRDNTLENCFFQISFCSPVYVRIIYGKRKGEVPLKPLLGKQNIQAKEVYWKISELFTCPSGVVYPAGCQVNISHTPLFQVNNLYLKGMERSVNLVPVLSKMVYKKVNKFGVIPSHVQNVSGTSKGNMLFYARQIISCISLFISKDYVNNELMFMFFNRVLQYERFN